MAKIESVKNYIREEWWWEISDEFIEGWFDYFNKMGLTSEEIGQNIISEYVLATSD